jgi:ArsR family transcriptional regulator
MSDKRIYVLQADTCKVLGHPLRIEVIDLLQQNERCFSEILSVTGGLKSNLSQHLSVMTAKGILVVRREGQNTFFSLASPKVAAACTLMREVLVENIKKQREIIGETATYG